VAIDQAVPAEVLEKIHALPHVIQAKQLAF
jgi:hypothetical protein